MSNFQVVKRDGREVEFHADKIYAAIKKAYIENGDLVEEGKLQVLTDKVLSCIVTRNLHSLSVEEIQDIVEDVLLQSKEVAVAKKYIAYRAKRTQVREANMRLMMDYKDIPLKMRNRRMLNGKMRMLMVILLWVLCCSMEQQDRSNLLFIIF